MIPPRQSSDGQKRVSDNMIRIKTKVDNFLSYSEPVDCHSETEVPSTTFRNSEMIPPRQSSDGQKRVSDNMIRIKTENDNFLSYSETVDCHSETEVPSTTFRNSEMIPPRQSSDGQKRVSDNMIRIKTKVDNFLSYSEPVDCHSETEVPSTTFRNSEMIPPRQSSDGQKRVSDNMIRIKTKVDNFLSYSEPVDCHSETEVPSTTFRNSEMIPPRQSSDGQKRVSDNMIRIKTKVDNFLSYSEPVDCHSETEVPSTTFRNSEMIPPRQSSDGQKRVSDNMIRIKTENDNFLSYSEPVDCHSETEVPSTTFRNSEMIPPRQSSDGQKRVSDNMIRIKTENDNFLSYSEPVDCHSETEVPSTTFRNSEMIPTRQSSDGQKRVSDNMIRIKTENDNFLSYSEPVDCHSETEVPSTTFRNSEMIPPSQSSDGQKRVSDKMIRLKTDNDNFLSYSETVVAHRQDRNPINECFIIQSYLLVSHRTDKRKLVIK
ncbi:unnamed protein product [Caenorhabditis nigoni]